MTDLDICVCTYRRPHLKDTLTSLQALQAPTGTSINILVIDNDDTPSAQGIVDAFAGQTTLCVRYAHCPQENISIARNGALVHSNARYLAFIDDDEIATPDWLVHLFKTMKRDAAAVVLGPVDAVYDPKAPAWMRTTAIHETRPVWVDGKIITGYTCNVLMDMQSPAIQNLEFDLNLGRTGGEDTKFFTAAHQAGARISYAPNARVREDVPHNRAMMGWLLRRRFRMGQTHGRILGNAANLPATLRHLTIACGKVIFCLGAAAFQIFDAARRNTSVLRAALHIGTASGLLGLQERPQYGAEFAQDTAQ